MTTEEQELKQLLKDAAAPRSSFLATLKEQVVSTATQKNPQQSNLFSLIMAKLAKPVLTLGAFAIVGVGATVAYTMWMPRTSYVQDQAQIFANIAAANANLTQNNLSGNSPQQENSGAPATADATASTKMSAIWYQDPSTRGYVYSKNTATYEMGKSAQKCLGLVPYDGIVSKEESSTYFSKKDDYSPTHTKYVIYSGDDIYDYNLTVNTDQWQYRGGSYAVHLTNVSRAMPLAASSGRNMPEAQSLPSDDSKLDTMPVETPSTVPTNTVTDYFGSDAKIVATETIDGKKYYKIHWTFKTSCAPIQSTKTDAVVMNSPDLSDTVAVESLASADNFIIVKESYYKDSYSNANLIYTRKNTDEKSKTVSDYLVKSEFSFGFPVEVKTVNASETRYEEKTRTALAEYLQQNGLKLTKVNTKGFTLRSVNSNFVTVIPDQSIHLVDREFYSPKVYGQTLYEQNKDMFKPFTEKGVTYPNIQLSYDATGTVNWASVAIFKGKVDASVAIRGAFGTAQAVSKGAITVTLDGKQVNAQLYEEQIGSNSTEPNSGDNGDVKSIDQSAPEYTVYVNHFVVVDTVNSTVVVMTSIPSSITPVQLGRLISFATVSSTDKAGLLSSLKVTQSQPVGVMLK